MLHALKMIFLKQLTQHYSRTLSQNDAPFIICILPSAKLRLDNCCIKCLIRDRENLAEKGNAIDN